MTFADALATATAEIDAAREQARQRFEQSLIENRAADHLTAEEIDDLRAYEREHMTTWRDERLAEMGARLLFDMSAPDTRQ